MSKVIITTDTNDIPVTTIGGYAGICTNMDIKDPDKCYKRGLDCIKSNHGRALEFVQVYMILDGYSARAIREFYTHIGGAPTRLQESTRYVDYSDFRYVVPPSIEKDSDALARYESLMNQINSGIKDLLRMGIPKEDVAMALPLGMETKVVARTNLRQIIDMMSQRKCARAYWEMRKMMRDIEESLILYSDEWAALIKEEKIFKKKCEILGHCPESRPCEKGKKERI